MPYQDAGRDAVVLSPAGWPLSPQPERVEPMPGSAPSGATGNLLQQGVSRLYRALIDLLTPGTGQAPWPLPRTDLGASETRLPLAPGANPQADWYQLPGQRHSALLVRQPLRVDGELRGYLLLAQTGDALISLTNQALRRVTHLTLVLLITVSIGRPDRDFLVLVHYVNRLRRESPQTPLIEIVATGASHRLRAICLTSLTTIVGVMPLAYGIGGQDPFISSMGLALGYGLLFSTPLILLLVPCLYLINQDIEKGVQGLKVGLYRRVLDLVGKLKR